MSEPKPETEKYFQLRLTADLHRQLKVRAAQEGVTVTALIVRALTRLLAEPIAEPTRKKGERAAAYPTGGMAADRLCDT